MKNIIKAVKLPGSNEIFGNDDDSFEKSVLVSLLEESYKRKLADKIKIIVTEEYYLNNTLDEINSPAYPKYKKSTISFAELKFLYKKTFHTDYSPETEKERKRIDISNFEKQKERADAWGPWMYWNRLNNERKELEKNS